MWLRGFVSLISGIFFSTLGFQLWAGQSDVAVPETVSVAGGAFVLGSDRMEREYAYELDETAYGHSRTREWAWYESEYPRQSKELAAFSITRTPITNAQYAVFVSEANYRAPDVNRKVWQGYGLIHPYTRTRRHAWRNGAPPPGRDDHPVVLVSIEDARAYADWLSRKTDVRYQLPTEFQLEKALRGQDGRRFPWGNEFSAQNLNSHDAGPFDTTPVGRYLLGASPYGVLDAAGQVFEWTSTEAKPGRYIVKGGSWDDSGCGICRPAARHTRPATLKHILIGFRLVHE